LPTSGRAELNPGYETGSRVEIILSRLIDDAHLPMSFGLRVRQDLIQLARLQRRWIPGVIDTDGEARAGLVARFHLDQST